MRNQVLIASYAKDFIWLQHCLLGLRKFSKNFLPPVVCVTGEDLKGCMAIVDWAYPGAGIIVREGRPPQGFMRAQIAMLRGDEICRSADNIFFLGSDCLATDIFDAEQYLQDGKPVVLHRPYAQMDPIIWQKGTQRVLGFDPVCEFMGRLPSVYPRAIFGAMRDHVERVHGRPFDDYIYEADARTHDTSEANILGAFAYKFFPESCHWINGLTETPPPRGWAYPVLQMWSHGGIDRPMEACAVLPDGTNSVNRRPREIMDKILYGIPS